MLTIGVATASAHAFPRREMPAPDAILAKAPSEVTIRFSEDVNAHFSGITVRKIGGRRVNRGHAMRDPSNHKILSVELQRPLKVGAYVVNWHALSTDGHRTEGSYRFTVSR